MTSDVVRQILRDAEARLAELQKSGPENRVKVEDSRDLTARAAALRSRGISPIIAEIKPRILGRTMSAQEVASMAKNYEDMGACGISVLTQPTYFLGFPENARIAREASSLPVLRKDFILDERQLDEVASDLVLLIAAISHPLEELVEAARSRNMEPLVEVHSEAELEAALKTDARILGINNRNLVTLEVDLETFERLGPMAKASGLFVVAESGINSRKDVLRMEEAGADALLVGTSLMEEPELLIALNGMNALKNEGPLKRTKYILNHTSHRSGLQLMKITTTSDTRFGRYGGQFVPETLMQPLKELAEAYGRLKEDPEFRRELSGLLANFAGRPTPLYHARSLSRELGRKVYLKREDLVHGGAHKLNNVLGQGLVAKAMGKTRLIAETGAGQHGVASAMVGANLGLETEVYMGEVDIERQKMNVYRMELLGAKVIPVKSGSRTLKDAINEALRDWAASYETTHYLMGTVAGPHPYPLMVRELQSVIGAEARGQVLKAEGRLPDSIAACVGGGSNAMGIFSGFLKDETKLIAVEAGGRGTSHDSKMADHGACLNLGEEGVLHGAVTKILQDPYGQILESYSVAAGLDYPGVGPELAHLAEIGRITPAIADDEVAMEGFRRLSVLEGIIPALESSHAVGYALKNPEALGDLAIINLSGRGDKDLATVMEFERRGRR